ncbi:lysosomal-trafficking regulator mauve isoform X2 [Tachypleus tridentatus]
MDEKTFDKELTDAWECFLSSPSSNEEERSHLLDIFLTKFIWIEENGGRHEDARMCDWTSIANILAHYFLTDINKACHKVKDESTPSEDSEDNEVEPLRIYLLQERGWRIVRVLKSIGVKNLVCGKELAALFISLLPLCFKFPVEQTECQWSLSDVEDLEFCFKTYQQTRSLNDSLIRKQWKSLKIKPVHVKNLHKKRFLCKKNTCTKKPGDCSSSESEEEDETVISSLTCRTTSQKVALCKHSVDFDYFSKPYAESEIEMWLQSAHNETLNYQEEDRGFVDVLKRKVSVIVFCDNILNILQQICLSEKCQLWNHHSSATVEVFPFALETLQSIYKGTFLPSSWTSENVHQIQKHLLRILFTCAESFIVSKGCQEPFDDSATVKSLLSCVKDLLLDVEGEAAENCHQNQQHAHVSFTVEFCYEVMCGIFLFILSLIETTSALQNFARLVCLIRTLSEGSVTAICCKIITSLESQMDKDKIDKLIFHIREVVLSLKRIKLLHVHQTTCSSRRHHNCDLSSSLYHHDDVIGFHINHSITNMSPLCCIATVNYLLLYIFNAAQDEKTMLTVLQSIGKVGICCCLNVTKVWQLLLSKLSSQSHWVQVAIFSLMERHLICQLGGSNISEQNLCNVCWDRVHVKLKDQSYQVGSELLNFNSAHYIGESIIEDHTSELENPWFIVEMYKNLLELSNMELTVLITKHLLYLVKTGTEVLKQQIFLQVVLPLFLNADVTVHYTVSTSLKKQNIILECCMLALPFLLRAQKTVCIFRETGCLRKLCCLLQVPAFRHMALQALEVIIILETEPSIDQSTSKSLDQTSSQLKLNEFTAFLAFQEVLAHYNVQFLKESARVFSAENHSEEQLQSLKTAWLNLPELEKENVLTEDYSSNNDTEEGLVTKPDEQLSVLSAEFHEGEHSSLDSVKHKTKISDNGTLRHAENFQIKSLKNLAFVCDLWSTCHHLVQKSLIYRECLQSHPVACMSYNLLVATIQEFIESTCNERKPNFTSPVSSTNRLWKKYLANLIETLLSVSLHLGPIKLQDTDKILSQEDMLDSLKHYLLKFSGNDAKDLRMLYETLIHCAMESLDVLYKTERMTTRSETSPVHSMEHEGLDMLSSLDDTTNSELEDSDGYEADIEHQIFNPVLRKSATISKKLDTGCNSLVMRVILDMLLYYHNNPGKMYSSDYVEVAAYVIQRLTTMCQTQSGTCSVLYKQGIISVICEGFKDVLTSSSSVLKDFQSALVDLLAFVGQYWLSADELQKLIDLFKMETAPVSVILKGLKKLFENLPIQPSYFLSFPNPIFIPALECANNSTNGNESYFINTAYPESSHTSDLSVDLPRLMHAQFMNLQNQGDQCKTMSAWSVAGAVLPLSQENIWSPRTKGFSFVTWLAVSPMGGVRNKRNEGHSIGNNPGHVALRTENFSDTDSVEVKWEPTEDKVLHVLSVSSDLLLFEMWVTPERGDLIFRITNATSQSYLCLAEGTCRRLLKPERWHCVGVNCKETSVRKTSNVVISIFVDGYQEKNLSLNFKNPGNKKNQTSCILLGHSVEVTDRILGLGTLMLFKDVVMTKELSFHLSSLGPDFTSLTDCELGNEVWCPPHCASQLVHSGLSQEILSGLKMPSLRPLQEALLAVYVTKNPNTFLLYPHVVGSSGSILQPLSSFSLASAGFRVVSEDQRSSQQQPIQKKVIAFVRLEPTCKHSLHFTVTQLGGTAVFIFLLARVVEVSDDEATHAAALELLLQTISKHQCYRKQFCDVDGMQLLKRVLSSRKCKSGYLMLHVFVSACVNIPVTEVERLAGSVAVDQHSDALIVDPELFATAVSVWSVWEKINENVLKMFLAVMEVLVRERHPHQMFNINQMLSVQIFDKLLLMLKEKFIHLENGRLSVDAVNSMTSVICYLLGSPPDLVLLTSLCDCILLLHRATSTYVCHARASFYFLISPHARSRCTVPITEKKTVLRSGSTTASSSQVDLDVKERQIKADRSSNFVKNSSEAQQLTSSSEHLSAVCGTAQSKKLRKALTNLRIKQSSTGMEMYREHVVGDSKTEVYQQQTIQKSEKGHQKQIQDDSRKEDHQKDVTQDTKKECYQESVSDDSKRIGYDKYISGDFEKESKQENISEDSEQEDYQEQVMQYPEKRSYQEITNKISLSEAYDDQITQHCEMDSPKNHEELVSGVENYQVNQYENDEKWKLEKEGHNEIINWCCEAEGEDIQSKSQIQQSEDRVYGHFEEEKLQSLGEGLPLEAKEVSSLDIFQKASDNLSVEDVIQDKSPASEIIEDLNFDSLFTATWLDNKNNNLIGGGIFGTSSLSAVTGTDDLLIEPPSLKEQKPKEDSDMHEYKVFTKTESKHLKDCEVKTSERDVVTKGLEREEGNGNTENTVLVEKSKKCETDQKSITTLLNEFTDLMVAQNNWTLAESDIIKNEDDQMSIGSSVEIISEPESIDDQIGEWEVISDVEESDSDFDGLTVVCVGLLNLLEDVILTIPESLVSQVLGNIIRPDMLIVLAHHRSGYIRSTVVKVISAYLQTAFDEQINGFLKMKGFHLLANQLHQYSVTSGLVDACFTLLIGRNFTFDGEFQLTLPLQLNSVQLMACVPLMALLPNCASDTPLCHNVIYGISKVCQHSSSDLRTLLENGLAESVCNLIVEIGHSEPRPTDVECVCEQDLLKDDVFQLLHLIASTLFGGIGAASIHMYFDLLTLLYSVEQQSQKQCGSQMGCVQLLRECQCVVFQAALDFVYLYTNVLASHSSDEKLAKTGSRTAEAFFSLMTILPESLNPYSIRTPGEIDYPASVLPSLSLSVQDMNSSIMPYSDNRRFSLGGASPTSKQKSTTGKELGVTDATDRFRRMLIRASDFVIYRDADIAISPKEKSFTRGLLQCTIQGVVTVLERQKKTQGSHWFNIMWSAKDTVRAQMGRLFLALTAPSQPIEERFFCVECVVRERRCLDITHSILHSSQQNDPRIVLFICDLLYNQTENMSGNQLEDISTFLRFLHKMGASVLSTNREDIKAALENEILAWKQILNNEHEQWIQTNRASECRVLQRHENLTKLVSQNAMSVTRTVVEAQNMERKLFIENIKSMYSQGLAAKRAWLSMITQLTHERATWFFEKSYPQSWELDPTEGPQRVRRRIRRCHLHVNPRFLMPEYQYKLDPANHPPPLAYLFEEYDIAADSASLIEKLHMNERISYTCTCTVITPSQETPGEVLIGNRCIHFVGEETAGQVVRGDRAVVSQAWPFDNIKEIVKRRFQLQDNALEIFLTNGLTYLVAFHSTREQEEFFSHLMNCPLPQLVEAETLTALTHMWRERTLTNFEYLTQLNKLAGRSFNDLMQYPVFPFILCDYSSPTINLKDPDTYRCLSRPMAIQDKSKEEHYVKLYNYLKSEEEQSTSSDMMLPAAGSYHYGSHYSNSGTVLHFLVRLPPFTQMFLSYQDHNFDIPDRTFHSLSTTWRLSSGDSTTDVKELIPEFFFIPEFLINSEGFNFGVRQMGEKVHDVCLPPWCRNDPRLFILIHRQSLESDYVTENLHSWIDLVFGYKQTGKAAVEAINVFHPSTYYGMDVNKTEDPVKRKALQTMIKTFGQMPRQLFNSPHPPIAPFGSEEIVHTRSALSEVQGLKWGGYVGSLCETEPNLIWRRSHPAPIACLLPLITNDVFGLALNTCLILSYKKEKASGVMNTTYVTSAALITWGYQDGVVRIKLRKDHPTIPLIQGNILDPICICASVPDCNLLFLGHTSGIIRVHQLICDSVKLQVEEKKPFVQLCGHSGQISTIQICKGYSIAVSGSDNGQCIIWDLNRLSYVRTLQSNGQPVLLIAISETLGDVAVVSHVDTKSLLKVYTINGKTVGEAYASRITALCYSSAPEGISINVIATGHFNGNIRLWSSWDLSPVRLIKAERFSCPVVCLTYSFDNQHLYAANSEGTVLVWERPVKGLMKTPRFLTLI